MLFRNESCPAEFKLHNYLAASDLVIGMPLSFSTLIIRIEPAFCFPPEPDDVKSLSRIMASF